MVSERKLYGNTRPGNTEIKFRSDVTVQLVKHNAADTDVVWAARVSTTGERSLEEAQRDPAASRGLIKFLMKNRHGTPFEHNSMTFLISAPIVVFREFQRHRVGWSYNESSGRYRELEPVFYVPNSERKLVQTGKPGQYEFTEATLDQHKVCSETMAESYLHTFDDYRALLERGIAREVARFVLPLGTYSSMYATCNARSLMSFLSLRTKDDRAAVPSFPMREIEMVAELMEELWAKLMPITYDAFNQHGRQAP